MPNTRQAHRLGLWAKAQGRQDALIEALFRGHFIAGLDMGDEDTLVATALEAGLDADAARAFLRSDALLGDVLADLKFALDAEIAGVPCFVIEREFAIPGAQPSDVLARYFDKAIAHLAAQVDAAAG